MAMDVTKFFEDLSTKVTWSAGVAFERSNALPIDKYSVFESLTAAENYIATSGVAYPGQVIAVQGETAGEFSVYYIDGNGSLQQVGKSTEGDEASIHLDENGKLSLFGFADAEAGAQLSKDADGKLVWAKPSTETVDGMKSAITSLDGRVTTAESKITTAEGKITNLETKVGSIGNVMNFAGVIADIANVGAIGYEAGDVIIEKKTSGDTVVTTEYICVEEEVDGVSTKRWESLGDPDGVVALEGRVSTLETWKTGADTTISTNSSNLSSLTSTVGTADDEASATGSVFARIAQNAADIATKASQADLNTATGNISANATAISGLDSRVSAAETNLGTKVDQSTYNTGIANINEAIGNKADANSVYTKIEVDNKLSEGLGNKVDSSTYTQKISEIEGTVSGHTSSINALNTTVSGHTESINTINGKIADMASANALSDLTTTVNGLSNTVGGHTTSISSLQGSVTTLTNDKADKTTVEGINTRLTEAEGKITAHEAEYNTLSGKVTANEQAITALQESANTSSGAISGLQTSINTLEGVVSEYKTANDKAVAEAKATAEAAQSAADGAQAAADEVAGDLADYIDEASTAHTALDGRIEALEGQITGLSGAMHFKGVVNSDPTAEGFVVDEYVAGDVVVFGEKEYVFNDGKFVEFGDVSAEGDRIAALETKVGEAGAEGTDPTGLFALVAGNTAKISANETNIGTVTSNLNALTTTVGENTSKIGTVEGALNTLTQTVANNKTSIEALLTEETNRAIAAEEANANNISALNTTVINLSATVDSHTEALTWNKFSATAV